MVAAQWNLLWVMRLQLAFQALRQGHRYTTEQFCLLNWNPQTFTKHCSVQGVCQTWRQQKGARHILIHQTPRQRQENTSPGKGLVDIPDAQGIGEQRSSQGRKEVGRVLCNERDPDWRRKAGALCEGSTFCWEWRRHVGADGRWGEVVGKGARQAQLWRLLASQQPQTSRIPMHVNIGEAGWGAKGIMQVPHSPSVCNMGSDSYCPISSSIRGVKLFFWRWWDIYAGGISEKKLN